MRGAARAAEGCLDRHGWDARLADGGRTTNAKAPRKLKTYPYQPWYSVAFYRDGKVIRWNAYRLKLTYREGKLAAACTRAGVR